ncbi:hypothetical protein [Pedobacter sp. AJM]|uniref:hypothetical protein n=1 Tax=Pedobacter sp. AJM TaxID=2003629 RepID=UPI000B4AD17F|nr:hypothetical protein [Pedobacter sp. AJM]OWK69609.1 hypothetical protein CBW18_15815 [Pedobacter sp. AJM]
MKNSIKNISKAVFALALFTLVFTSCKKENDTTGPLSLKGAKASVSSVADTIVGRWGNPRSGGAAFGTVYANVITGAQDTVGSIAHQLLFSSHNNSTISPASGYTLSYLNTTKALSAIDASDVASATTVSSLGIATTSNAANTSLTANGWLIYSTGGTVAAVQNLVVFVSDGSTTYALKFSSAVGEGTSTHNRGVYYFDRGTVL